MGHALRFSSTFHLLGTQPHMPSTHSPFPWSGAGPHRLEVGKVTLDPVIRQTPNSVPHFWFRLQRIRIMSTVGEA